MSIIVSRQLPPTLLESHNHYNTGMIYAAAEVQEPYPTTEALLEKLQEVLQKADVEVCSLQASALRDAYFTL